MKIGFIKRLFSFLICIVITAVSIPITAFEAFGFQVGDDPDAEEIMYSELYYTYADYLYTNEYFKNYRSDVTRVSGYVLGEYRNTSHYTLSVVSNFLDTVTSPTEITKYAFDHAGLSEYQFNDDIDAANVEFAKHLCDLYTNAADDTNEGAKIAKGFKNVSDIVSKLVESYEELLLEGDLEGLEKGDLYDMFLDQAFYGLKECCPNLAEIIPNLSPRMSATIAAMPNISGFASDALDFTAAFTLSFMMQDVQIDIIDDIIAISEKDSTLYKGMTRLRSQLSGGAVTYFIDTFLGDFAFEKIVDHFAGQITKSLSSFAWTSNVSLVVASVQIVNTVLFKWIMGADYSSYVCANILKSYSDQLSIALNDKTKSFSISTFTVDDIQIFENSAKAYIALNNALCDKLSSISSHNEAYDEDYLLAEVDGGFAFYKYINNVVYIIRNTPEYQRIRNHYDGWTVTSHTSFAPHTDDLEDGYIYTDGNFYGNIIVHHDCTLTVPKGMEVSVSGKIRVIGPYGYNPGVLNVDGTINIAGDLELVPYRSGYSSGRIALDDDNDILKLGGDFVGADGYASGYITGGTIILNGDVQQNVKGLSCYDLYVFNPYGIKYESDTYIKGEFDLCGNPLDNSGYYTYIHNSAYLAEGSDYKDLTVAENDYQLKNFIQCNLYIPTGNDLIIPEGIESGIIGNVRVAGYYGSDAGYIDVDGRFIVDGNLDLIAYREGYGPGKLIMDEYDDELIVSGNLTSIDSSGFTNVTNGTIVFNGTETQELNALTAYNVVVDNPAGIKYLSDTHIYGNYYLCGNPLYNGSYVTYVYEGANLCDASDFKNVVLGSKTFTLANDVKCQLTVSSERTLIIPDGETATLYGDVRVVGRFGGEAGAIDIDGTLNVEGNLDFIAYRDGYGPGKLIMDESDDKLIITGNLTAVETSAFTDVTNGTVIFNGNDTQKIKALKAYNIKVLNSKGIKYLTDTYVYGNYDLCGNPLDNASYVTYVYDGAKLCDGSDYKNVIIGSNNFTISNDVTCQLTVPTEHNLIIPEGETASIFGDVKVIGNFGGPAGTIDIDGTFNIVGNLELAKYRDPYGPGKLIMDEPDDKLIITGNLTSTEERGFDSLTDGTIIFSGSETQQVKSLVAYNIIVNNPSGIKYLTDTKVYGNYDLCGNPLDNGSYKTYIFETTTFADGSDYKDLIISCNDYILTDSIKANITVPTARNLYTPENDRIVIDGNVTVVGYYGSPSGILDIDGTLEITGNLTLSKVYDHYSPGTVIMDEWDDALYIGGNFTGGVSGSGKFSAGKVVFNGDKLQNVQIITAPVVILENESEEGVRFNNGSTVSILFDHKSNSFSLIGNGYSFVDFDGDGIKDNLDEFPRVGYSCIITVQSESSEKGSVDADSIETAGGAVHTVTATPNTGCKFISWIDSNGNTVCDTPEFIFVAKGDATYTATFEANPAYAALKEKIEEAGLIDQSEYSTESFELLTAAILDARNVLTDDITEEVSQGMISVLEDAINALVLKKPVAIQLDGINEIYYSDTNTFAELNFKLVYDNGTVENLSVNDCTIENFDLYVIGQQCITVKYADFAQDIIFNVIPVSLDICSVSEISDQLFKGEEIRVIPEVYCPLNSLVLEAGKDFTVEYESAGKTGLVTVTLTGCGNYDSEIVCSYNVYCEHDYIADEHVESTCVTQGYYTEICSICSDVVINQLELSSDHRFGEWNVSEERGCSTAGTEIRICSYCDAFEIRSIPAIGEHKFGDWVTTTEPTELQNGIKTRKCDNCGAAEIEEIAKLEMTNPFTDIKPEQWYTDGILWCYHKGYMAGLSDSDFGRKQNVTRSMFVTILAKIDGADLTPYADKSSFSDVSVGKWYSSAIEWAYQNGYTSGIAEGVFGYKNDVTREQLAMFLYTYSDKKAYDISGRADLSVFIDLDRVHSWARDAVSWAVNYGLISGTSATTLAPRASATRAELALIIKNYVEEIKIKSN